MSVSSTTFAIPPYGSANASHTGYTPTQTRLNRGIPYCSNASSCSGVCSARMPPCIFGCRVTTRWSKIGGTPVIKATSVTSIFCSAKNLAVPPEDTIFHPKSCNPLANTSIPFLSCTEINARFIVVSSAMIYFLLWGKVEKTKTLIFINCLVP